MRSHPDDYRTPLPGRDAHVRADRLRADEQRRALQLRRMDANGFALLAVGCGTSPYEIRRRRPPTTAEAADRARPHALSQGRPDRALAARRGRAAGPAGRELQARLHARACWPRSSSASRPASPTRTCCPIPPPLLGGQGRRPGRLRRDATATGGFPSGRVFFDPDADIANPATPPRRSSRTPASTSSCRARFRDPVPRQRQHRELVDLRRLRPAAWTRDALATRPWRTRRHGSDRSNDYRVLQPRLVTDPNRNRTAVAFDALGHGGRHGGDGQGRGRTVEGDSLDGFDADLTAGAISTHSSPNPLADAARHAAAARPRASSTTSIATSARRTSPTRSRRRRHAGARDPRQRSGAGAADQRSSISFSYSDGFGREIQKKIQAEPGPVPMRDADGEIVVGADGQPQMTPNDVSPRWVGSGWTIFNNKGKPVRQYEPFFSRHAPLRVRRADTGVSPVLFYDPVERVVATLHPNHTYEKVVFDPWQQTTYDVNDTVAADGAQTGDPRTDPDVAGYVREYFKTQPADLADLARAAHRQAGWAPHEQRRRAEGRRPRRHAHHRAPRHAGPPLPDRRAQQVRAQRRGRSIEDKFATRVELDIEGNQREVAIDAQATRVVMRYDYDMLGNRIHQASMEAGERWMLNDVAGKPIRAWDSRGFTASALTYDALRRPTGLFVTRERRGAAGRAHRLRREPGRRRSNHRAARVYQVFDGAGVVTSEAYDFKGNLLREPARAAARDYKQRGRTGCRTRAAERRQLHQPHDLRRAQPPGHRHRAGRQRLSAHLQRSQSARQGGREPARRGGRPRRSSPTSTTTPRASASGSTTATASATTYEYDPLTFRLTHLKTTRPAGPDATASQLFQDATVVQDLRYTYDPVGNITRIEDAALKTDLPRRPAGRAGRRLHLRRHLPPDRSHGPRAHRADGVRLRPAERQLPRLSVRRASGASERPAGAAQLHRALRVRRGRQLRASCATAPTAAVGRARYDYDEDSLIEAGKQSNRLTRTTVGNGLNRVETYTYTTPTATTCTAA